MANPYRAPVVIWDIFAHLSHPHDTGRHFVRHKKGLIIPVYSLHIWTGSNKAYDNIFSGALALKREVHPYVGACILWQCTFSHGCILGRAVVMCFPVSKQQITVWKSSVALQRNVSNGWNRSGPLFFLYSPAFLVGEFFLLSFRGLTKVIKIATKLPVSNSCVWKKTDRRMLEVMFGFEKLFIPLISLPASVMWNRNKHLTNKTFL